MPVIQLIFISVALQRDFSPLPISSLCSMNWMVPNRVRLAVEISQVSKTALQLSNHLQTPLECFSNLSAEFPSR